MGKDADCFLIHELPRIRRWLRRYRSRGADRDYFSAMVPFDEVDCALGRIGAQRVEEILGPDYRQDPRWPTHGEQGQPFDAQDAYQVFVHRLYTGPGGITTLEDAPPGAMWDAFWMHDWRTGGDGRSLMVKLPNGDDWFIDGRASNCTMPDEDHHRCWMRHGEAPKLTVNNTGFTCAAGGGSIWSRQGEPNEWHGFLTDGRLHQC